MASVSRSASASTGDAAGVSDGGGGREEGVVGDDDLAAFDVERAEDDFDGARAAADGDGVLAAAARGEGLFEGLAVLAERELAAAQARFDEGEGFLDVVVAEDDGSSGDSHGHLATEVGSPMRAAIPGPRTSPEASQASLKMDESLRERRQTHDHAGAAAGGGAQREFAAVEAGDTLGDGEAEAGTAGEHAAGGGAAVEALDGVRGIIGGEADAGVADLDDGVLRVARSER